MISVRSRLEREERWLAAELVLRMAGLGLLGACAPVLRWLYSLSHLPPLHQATPEEFAMAVLTCACLSSGLALLLEGAGLFRLQPRPPRAMLP